MRHVYRFVIKHSYASDGGESRRNTGVCVCVFVCACVDDVGGERESERGNVVARWGHRCVSGRHTSSFVWTRRDANFLFFVPR